MYNHQITKILLLFYFQYSGSNDSYAGSFLLFPKIVVKFELRFKIKNDNEWNNKQLNDNILKNVTV